MSAGPEQSSRLAGRRGLRGLAVAAAWLSTLAAAAAVVIVVGGGHPFRGDESTRSHESGPPPTEAMLARGAAPVGGAWEIQSYRSRKIVHEGTVFQPAGLGCIRLMLSRPPRGTPLVGNGQCGVPGRGGFDVMNLPVRDGSGRVEVILFGDAPEDAAVVELTAPGGKSFRVHTIDVRAKFRGDLWVMPIRYSFDKARIDWLRGDGTPAGAGRDVSMHLERGKELAAARARR